MDLLDKINHGIDLMNSIMARIGWKYRQMELIDINWHQLIRMEYRQMESIGSN